MTALGDSTRRAIFERLPDRPGTGGERAAELPVSRPAVSQHLRVLREAGIVVVRPAGTRRIYSVDPAGLAEMRGYFDPFWNHALPSLNAPAETENESDGRDGR